MSYNSGSNRAYILKSASRFALDQRLELLVRLNPELYYTPSNYY